MAFYQLGVIIANLHGQPDFFTQENGEVIDKSVHVYTFGSGYLQDVNWAWKLDSYDIYFGIFLHLGICSEKPVLRLDEGIWSSSSGRNGGVESAAPVPRHSYAVKYIGDRCCKPQNVRVCISQQEYFLTP